MLRLSLITASNRQPEWVDAGADDYAKRLRGRCTLEIKTVPLARRTATTPAERAIHDEGERMLAAVPAGAHVVALLETGKPWSTKELAAKLEGWMQRGAPVALLVGGPDGLSRGASRAPTNAGRCRVSRCRTASFAWSPPKRCTALGRCWRTTPITAREHYRKPEQAALRPERVQR